MKKPPKYHAETKGQNLSCPLQKWGNIPNMSMPPYESRSNRSRLTSSDLKAKLVRLGDRWQVDGRSQDPWTACYQSWLTANPPFQPTHRQDHTPPPPPLHKKRRNRRIRTHTCYFRVDHYLWGHWAFINHHNTELTPCLCIDCIRTPLVMDKLIRDLFNTLGLLFIVLRTVFKCVNLNMFLSVLHTCRHTCFCACVLSVTRHSIVYVNAF